MLAQRGGEICCAADRAESGAKRTAPTLRCRPRNRRRKSSPTSRNSRSNRCLVKLEARLADPALFGKDPAGFQKIAADLDKERTDLSAMEEEWLELEMLREELEG
jgi:hypothetical protein